MTPAEFVNKAIGVPWVRWRSDWHGMDCYGLLVLWHREVCGIEIGDVSADDPSQDGRIAAVVKHAFGSEPRIESLRSDMGWVECTPEPYATCWMTYRDGAPTHCGVLLDVGRVLHSDGSDERGGGSVRVSRLKAMELRCGAIKYYRREQ